MNEKKERKQEVIVETQEPSAEYARNKEIRSFFGQPMIKGSYAHIDPHQFHPEIPSLFYTHPHGEISVGDAISLLPFL